MYIPPHFREEDLGRLHEFMRANAFATLVTHGEGGLFATPLPFLLDAAPGGPGRLRAHMARANPHWQDLRPDAEVLVLFQGPHAYVSPTWYEKQPAVPTWNYAAVHAYGLPRLLGDAELEALLHASVDHFEEPDAPRPDLPADYLRRMMRAVVGFEIALTRLEGKFKLSQNKPEGDRTRVQVALAASPRPSDRDTAELMRTSA